MITILPALVLLLAGGSQETVDLLSLVDPVKGAQGGSWTKSEKGLVSPGRPFSRVLVPYAPPEEYDVTVVVERHGDSNALNLGLAVGDVQFLVILDALFGGEYLSGIELIDGKPFMSNETTVKGAYFAQGVPSTVVCSVRKDRVSVQVDGKKILDWKADYRRLSLMQGWGIPPKNGMLVGSWTSVVRISKLELVPVSGAGRRLEGAPAPPPPVDRLGPIFEHFNDDSIQVRNAAAAELETLPAEWLPRIHALAAASDSAEVRFRVEHLGVPPAWGRILRTDIRRARQTVRSLEASTAQHEAVLAQALEVPPAEATAAFESLLLSRHPMIRSFALRGHSLLPGPSAARAVEFLDSPETCAAAADVLLTLNDDRVVPRVVEVYAGGDARPAAEAARVLQLLSPAAALDAARRAKVRVRAADFDVLLLERAGAEEDLLARMIRPEAAGRAVAGRALSRIGGPKTAAALRSAFAAERERDLLDDLLSALRDPAWGSERLAALKAVDGTPTEEDLDEAAAAGGPGLRDAVRAWLETPELKVSLRRRLLVALGAVGGREDVPLLLRALADPRLIDAAAEGLDRLGDPAAAGTLLDAWKKSSKEIRLGALPAAKEVEDTLAEILADPEGYDRKWKPAFELAARGWTPRLRETAFKSLPADLYDSRDLRLFGARLLAATPEPADDRWIAALRARSEPGLRLTGLLQAAVRGDEAAGVELAVALAGDPRGPAYRAFGSDRLALMDETARAGPRWSEAVAAEWRRRPGWDEGAVWLAVRGDAAARTHVLERLDVFPEQLRRYLDVRWAAGGDAAALRRILGRGLKGPLLPEEEAAFREGAAGELRALAFAQARLRMRQGETGILRIALSIDDPGVVPLARQVIGLRGAEERRSDTALALCIEALGRRKAKEAAGELRGLLRAKDPKARAAAAEALAAIGDREALSFLRRLVDDPFSVEMNSPPPLPRRRVWHAAMEALETLTGVKSEGTSTTERRTFWRSWDGDRR